MKNPTSIDDFVQQASGLQGEPKTLYINQSDYTKEETIVTDEDTTGRGNMQLFHVIASAGSIATYWREPFYDTGEVEQLNIELDVLKTFTRTVVSLKEIEELKKRFGLQQDSIGEEKDPT